LQKHKFKYLLGLCVLCLCLLALTACTRDDARVGALPPANGTIDVETMTADVTAAIDELSFEYHDNYSFYYTEDEYKDLYEQLMGSFTGIGVYIYDDPESDYVTVMSPIKGSPAYAAGVQPGDQFVKVDGKDAAQYNSDELSALFKSKKAGTPVDIVVKRADGSLQELTIVVDVVEIMTVESKYLPDCGFALVYISSFTSQTGVEFINAMNELETNHELKGLILDLRANGGGEITGAMQVCDYFVPKEEPIMYIDSADGTVCYVASSPGTELPLVVLADENSASASEVLLGCIKDYQLGTIIGETSFGKGIVQDLVQLKSDAGLRFTSAEYRTAGGNNIHKIGIEPDIEYQLPEGTDPYAIYSMDPEQDPELKFAIEQLQKDIAAKAAN